MLLNIGIQSCFQEVSTDDSTSVKADLRAI
jgi:hypothetical protein